MDARVQAKLFKLLKLVEEFGFELGMHNRCFDTAIQKRLDRFSNNDDQLLAQLLELISVRLSFLKDRSYQWHRENEEHKNAIMRWREILKESDRLDFDSANIGTILAISKPGKFSGKDYVLKTNRGWISIANITTTFDIFNADLVSDEPVSVERELVPKRDRIFLVYDGFNGKKPKHITDLKALPLGTVAVTPDSKYIKTSQEKWAKLDNRDLEVEDYTFSRVLLDRQAEVE